MRWSLGREENGEVEEEEGEVVMIFLIWEGDSTVRIFAPEGVGRLASSRERRSAVQTCGTDFGDEECRDHSAMQSFVPSPSFSPCGFD